MTLWEMRAFMTDFAISAPPFDICWAGLHKSAWSVPLLPMFLGNELLPRERDEPAARLG